MRGFSWALTVMVVCVSGMGVACGSSRRSTGDDETGSGGEGASGGSANGGTAGNTAGGSAGQGGSPNGGSVTGGTSSGGSPTGGGPTGGSATGGSSTGGSSGTGGSADPGGAGGMSPGGSAGESGGGSGGAPTSCSEPNVFCPPGYSCTCDPPNNPGAPADCSCHKLCDSADDCADQSNNTLCGCGGNVAAGVCVSSCFCLCG